MRHVDLFTGIGGFALAAQRVWKEEYEPVVFCEKEKLCRRVLKKHWPDVPIVNDIHHMRGEAYHAVKLVTAGYPCQGESKLGHRKGEGDHRWLWPKAFKVIRQTRPDWFIGENVAHHVNMGLDQVLTDLESEGCSQKSLPWESGIPWYEDGGGSPDLRDRSYMSGRNLCRRSPRISPRLDALGNSIVPQIAQVIMTAIKYIEERG